MLVMPKPDHQVLSRRGEIVAGLRERVARPDQVIDHVDELRAY